MESMEGNPHDWTVEQWKDAFAYFNLFYGPGKKFIFPTAEADEFNPPVTFAEFMPAVLKDYRAADERGDYWAFDSDERARTRNIILIARGVEPVGPESIEPNP